MISANKPISRCTCLAIRTASRHVAHAYDQALAPSGLRTGQFAVLRVLSQIRSSSVQHLAEIMQLDRTTMGRNLRPLERDGMILITVDPADRRIRSLAITARGRACLAAAEPLWQKVQERLEARFGVEQTHHLHAAFASILALDLSA
jgi:DNA-binding MarR family transcriptional regulator